MSKNYWHDIETGIDVPEIINVVVEIPKGSMNKYEYDKKYHSQYKARDIWKMVFESQKEYLRLLM